MTRYGFYGANSQDFLTYGGRILVHDNRHELEFLTTGATVRTLPSDIPEDQTLPIRFHPGLASV
jgi:hypothetical protein